LVRQKTARGNRTSGSSHEIRVASASCSPKILILVALSTIREI